LHPVTGQEYLTLGLSALEQVFHFAKEKKEDYIVHLGDVFHLKDRIPVRVWNEFMKVLGKWDSEGLHSFWLMGNHDVDKDIAIKSFSISNRAHPIYSPAVHTLNNFRCLFLPYNINPEVITQYEDIEIVFMHDYFRGVSYFREGITAREGFPLSRLKNIPRTFSGHAHMFQEIVRGRVWHIGSPYQTSFNEVGQKKYFAHLTPAFLEFHEFKFPEFVQVDMGKSGELVDVKDSYVKLVYEFGTVTDEEVQKERDRLLEYGARIVKIEARKIAGVSKQRITLAPSAQKRDFIKEYVDLKGKEFDKKLLCEVGEGFTK
jgi:DNA repair exonuclease SbcCD nuclease subunit